MIHMLRIKLNILLPEAWEIRIVQLMRGFIVVFWKGKSVVDAIIWKTQNVSFSKTYSNMIMCECSNNSTTGWPRPTSEHLIAWNANYDYQTNLQIKDGYSVLKLPECMSVPREPVGYLYHTNVYACKSVSALETRSKLTWYESIFKCLDQGQNCVHSV